MFHRNLMRIATAGALAAILGLAAPGWTNSAQAQDSTLLGAGAGAGGGAGIGFALGGPVGAVVGGLVGAGVGAGSGHLIGKDDKKSSAAYSSATGSDLTYQVQNELNAAGYSVGNPDGRNGPRTAAAIRSYQANNGLVQDGQPSVALLDNLRARRGVAPAPVAPATAQPAGYAPAPALPQMPQAQPAANNCRPYESRTTIDGKETVTRGTACLQADGTWKPVN